ncbi:hypothetical protein ACFQAV_11375 [Companilactobacillus huachuanensis]|uniref:Uncharacterized protein n=1 Tax=Companilactobacillus huachuanensis TaxID=2559914 RepID=A0ABW1RPV9_9LACO|nr:hypothetical protein [Companilactobacillus huachuanensis]
MINRLTTNLKKVALLNSKKIYMMNYLVLFITSLLYGIYILTVGMSQHIGFQQILRTSPYTSIMFIVVLLNLMVGYALWIKGNEGIANNKKTRFLIIDLAICQLIVGNIFSFISFVATYWSFKNQPDSTVVSTRNSLTGTVAVATVLYVLCFFLLISMTIH